MPGWRDPDRQFIDKGGEQIGRITISRDMLHLIFVAFNFGDQRYQVIYWRNEISAISRSDLGTSPISRGNLANILSRLKSFGAISGFQENWMNRVYRQNSIPEIGSVTPHWLNSRRRLDLILGGELGTLIFQQTQEGFVLTNHPEYLLDPDDGTLPPPPPPHPPPPPPIEPRGPPPPNGDEQDLTMLYVVIGIVAVILIAYGIWKMKIGAKKSE